MPAVSFSRVSLRRESQLSRAELAVVPERVAYATDVRAARQRPQLQLCELERQCHPELVLELHDDPLLLRSTLDLLLRPGRDAADAVIAVHDQIADVELHSLRLPGRNAPNPHALVHLEGTGRIPKARVPSYPFMP